MKDFPVFTTENGAASLILKEIPYRKESFIHLWDSASPELLLEECISFCRICGAEKIYATGDQILEGKPLHTIIYEMKGIVPFAEEEVPNIFPVTEANVKQWRQIYNEKMRAVDNASTLESSDTQKILDSVGTYFVHDRGELLGIAWLEGNRLSAIASTKPGCGKRVLKAMQSLIPDQQITLEVASTNTKAIKLYERMGLLKTKEISRWYQVL